MPKWERIEGGVTTPAGFQASAVHSGIKKNGALDMALICSERAAAAAGVFTTNLGAAAPVIVSRRNLEASRGRTRAVVVNSGNANAATGKAGERLANDTARAAARLLGVAPAEVLVASTGVIGVPIDPELIGTALPELVNGLSAANGAAAARSILTTDAFPKTCALRSRVGGNTVHIGGIAKGAGMIHPKMATMLSFITTDLAIPAAHLRTTLRAAVNESFNRISVDGDTSTNDTVILLASGLSGVAARSGSASGKLFQEGLTEVCQTLAQMIVKDGEGATRLVTIEVSGAATPADAERVARAVANSPLVKTALAGGDPNWGRIYCAAGYSGARVDPARIDIRVNGMLLCRRGARADFNESAARGEMARDAITLGIELHQGSANARMWTCDFTAEYIRINSSRS